MAKLAKGMTLSAAGQRGGVLGTSPVDGSQPFCPLFTERGSSSLIVRIEASEGSILSFPRASGGNPGKIRRESLNSGQKILPGVHLVTGEPPGSVRCKNRCNQVSVLPTFLQGNPNDKIRLLFRCSLWFFHATGEDNSLSHG